ncbi:MAG: ChbG/HpnK family deacetylase [Planctomycetota bacterium]
MSPVARLVVNADDAGLDEAGDARILEAADAGLLRSASVVASGRTARAFVAAATSAGLGVGLHLDLVELPPLGGPYRTLGRDRGRKTEVWARAASGALDAVEVADEVRLQWEHLVSLGADPDHLDAHNHLQLFRPVLAGLVAALGDRDDLVVRRPFAVAAGLTHAPPFPAGTLDEAAWDAARGAARWPRCPRFCGYRFGRRPGTEALPAPAPGTTELMVHLGGGSDRAFAHAPERDLELAFVCDSSRRREIEALGYRIGRFGDVA